MTAFTLESLIENVGMEQYRKACTVAWVTAESTGKSRQDEADLSVAHDICYRIWNADSLDAAKIDLLFEHYGQMPCYAVLMYLSSMFVDFPAEARQLVWVRYRGLLSNEDDRLAAPVAYSLWCDFFENTTRVEECWAALVTDDSPPLRLRRILSVSGPVPYDLKESLYQRLLPDPAWHEHIYDSLVWSAWDLYGKLDEKAARDLMTQLRISDRSSERFEEALQKGRARRGPLSTADS